MCPATPQDSSELIRLDHVGCSYKIKQGLLSSRNYTALVDVSFSVRTGVTLGVIGRNGAGKSTLLKLLAGIIQPNSGTISSTRELQISLLTLGLGFSPMLTGRDNAILGAMMLGHSKQEALAKLDKIIRFAELEDWADEPLRSYSSGMKARLGFGVAMEISPDVLLVDEVLGVGDEAFRNKSAAAMKEKMLSGLTVVFVSHQLPTIRMLCTEVIWIEKGIVRMHGATEEVLEAYLRDIKDNPSQP